MKKLLLMIVLAVMLEPVICVLVEPPNTSVEPPNTPVESKSQNISFDVITILLIIITFLISRKFNEEFFRCHKIPMYVEYFVITALCFILNILVASSSWEMEIKLPLIVIIFSLLPIAFRYHLIAEKFLETILSLVSKHELALYIYWIILYITDFWNKLIYTKDNVLFKIELITIYITLVLILSLLSGTLIDRIYKNICRWMKSNEICIKYKNISITILSMFLVVCSEPNHMAKNHDSTNLTNFIILIQSFIVLLLFLYILTMCFKLWAIKPQQNNKIYKL